MSNDSACLAKRNMNILTESIIAGVALKIIPPLLALFFISKFMLECHVLNPRQYYAVMSDEIVLSFLI